MDPRVTIGGVSYAFPVIHNKDRRPSLLRLSTSVTGLMRCEKDKEKRRLLELKLKMCRAQERRDVRFDYGVFDFNRMPVSRYRPHVV